MGITWKQGRVTEVSLEVPSARVVKLRCDTLLRLAADQPVDDKVRQPMTRDWVADAPVPGTYRLRADV